MQNTIFGRALTLALVLTALPMTTLADVPAVPELDPASSASAITILVGIGIVLRGRKRR